MTSLPLQMKRRIGNSTNIDIENKGNFSKMISTGSTLLDLAISGGRIRGGGLPGGIFVEIFGPEASGKSALVCEISGDIQRKGGMVRFEDPEGRIDAQYAQMYDLHINGDNYFQSDTITDVFSPIEKWNPEGDAINGIIVDSLAALSTEMEMNEGDKMGGRRGKEFSQELRKTCRIIKQRNFLMVCTNQIRDTMASFGAKHDSPGGWAIKFYASLRLQTSFTPQNSKIIKSKTVEGKEHSRVVGVNINVYVAKSSVWKPYRTAPVTIIFDYGIDNIRANLQYIKDNRKHTVYMLGGQSLDKSLDKAIGIIEKDNLEKALEEEVIDLWEDIESRFDSERKPKR